MPTPKIQEPEIMPPAPDIEPSRQPEEVPSDKNAPEKQAPEQDKADRLLMQVAAWAVGARVIGRPLVFH